MAERDDLAEALEQFKRAHDAESENRTLSRDDLRFSLLADQWDPKDQKKRLQDGRPCLTINRLPAFGRQVSNDIRQNRPSIKVRPADSAADVKTANVYNGMIRNIESVSSADVAYDTASHFAIFGGIGYFRIVTDYAHDDTFDLDLLIKRINNPFSVYGDPHSQAADASDWMVAFVTDDMSRAAFRRKYPGAELLDFKGGDDHTQLWCDEDSVQVAERWVRDEVKREIVKLSSGLVLPADQYEANRAVWDAQQVTVTGTRPVLSYRVRQHIMTGAGIIETNDWPGTLIPICPVYGDEVNIEGKRYFKSLFRDAKDAQRMLNYWRSASTEQVALQTKAPWVGPAGFADDDPRWETANTESHPYLEYKGMTPPQRQPLAGVPAGALQEAMNASDDLKAITGIYDASLGARSNETSGRAILARQREGDVSTFHFSDNMVRAIRYAGRVLVDVLPKIYTGERMVRVMGEDGREDMVAINNGVHDLARGKYDLLVDAGPSYTTRREESATFMTEMVRASPQTAPLMMDKLVKAIDAPDADTLAKRFQAMLPPAIQKMEGQQQGGDPAEQVTFLSTQLAAAQQQIQQLQQLANPQVAEQKKVEADTQAKRAAAALDQEKTRNAEAAAQRQFELDRMKLLNERARLGLDARRQRQESLQAGMQPSTEGEDAEVTQLLEDPVMTALAQQGQMMQQGFAAMLQGLQQIAVAVAAEKEAVRGPDGRIVGVRIAQPTRH